MTFEAGSSLLNRNAVTARLIDRGGHFQLVDSSHPTTASPIPTSTVNRSVSHQSHQSSFIDIAQPSNPPQQSDGVAFVLRPPTVPKEQCGSLNEAVHLEWLKGRGAAWVSGSPHLQYSKERGSFQFRVMDVTSPSPDPSGNLITESGLAAALDTLEDAALDECVSRHLIEGGDDRLHLNEAGVNKYYCPPRPLPKEVVIRGSCTCSSPTPDGFEAARVALRSLWNGRTDFGTCTADIRSRLSKVLQISVPHEVILHPSGSDAELIPLAIAAAKAKEQACTGVVNIVAAAGEVGSGTAPAAGGRHFSEFAPSGQIVKNGDLIADFPAATTVVELKPRSDDGQLIDNYDELVMNVVREHEQIGRSCFVVHAVDGSKTGLRLPSQELLERLKLDLGERLLVVLDACQCRSESTELDWFLQRGAVILVTSSKFFSAPGFCGAVLVPKDSSLAVLRDGPTPLGLGDYLTKHEVPQSITALHNSLPHGPKNIGLLLRWICGITEMEMFTAMGDSVKVAMREWVYGVRNLVCKRRPALELIDVECAECDGDMTRAGGVNSVVSIKFLTKCGLAHLDAGTLRRTHRHLTIDASKILPSHATEEERKIASLRCMVGQPVKLGGFGVLRLAIGAPMARDLARPGRLQEALKEDEKVLDKMIVMGKYCEEIRE